MEQWNNVGTAHFMHTIKSGRVIVVCNTNSLGIPVIRSKILKDVYEDEDASGPQRLSSGMLFDHKQAEHENPCFPQADRTLLGTKCKSDDEFFPADHNPHSSLDDDTTLKQLKRKLSSKKRKCIPKQEGKKVVDDDSDLHEPLINLKQKRLKTSKSERRRMNIIVVSSSTVDFVIKTNENLISEGSPQVICDKVQTQDEGVNLGGTSTNGSNNNVPCDYREPIICAQEYESCSNDPNKILYDHVVDSEPISMLVPSDGTSVDLEPLEIECKEFIDMPALSIQMENEITDAHNNSSFSMENISSSCIQVSDMDFDGIDGGSGLPKDFNSVLLEDKSEADYHTNVEDSPRIPDKRCDSYTDSIILSKIEDNVVNISNDMEFSPVPLEDKSEPDFPYELGGSLICNDKNCGSYQDSSIIFSKIEENVVSTQDMEFGSFPLENKTDAEFPNELEDSPTSPHKNFGSCQDSTISSKIKENEVSTEGSIANGMEFSSVSLEDKTEVDFPNELEDSLSSSEMNLGAYPDSIISLKSDPNVVSSGNTITGEYQPSICSNAMKNGLNCEGRSEAELLKANEKQTKALPITDGESHSSSENQTHDVSGTISALEPYLSPENLLSPRKAISPSCQEQLCLAMNSVEIWNDADQNKCKEKLFEKQTTKKASSLRSEMQHDKVTGSHKRPDKVRQRKIIISPRLKHSIKKSRSSKGNLEASRFSRILPNLSTDCTSIQSCSERAIEFSKQQMHDMESLALKLMNELKSMKDIVEQKLLFEAYRNVSLKNDADEVKSAIDSASKVEETSRKWLSIMARDCNRFCKIMKMTPNTPAASNDTPPPRERRKIVFADEAGGDLCHVKFFVDDDIITSSPVSDSAM